VLYHIKTGANYSKEVKNWFVFVELKVSCSLLQSSATILILSYNYILITVL